jgi:hypothetical protein
MIISINLKKVFDKIQHLFIIKNSQIFFLCSVSYILASWCLLTFRLIIHFWFLDAFYVNTNLP